MFSDREYTIHSLYGDYFISPFTIVIFNNGDIILKLRSKSKFIENDESIKFLDIKKCIDYAFDVSSKGIIKYFENEELKKREERIELERFDRIIE